MKNTKRAICYFLSIIITLGLFAGCQAEPAPTETAEPANTEQNAPPVQMSDIFKEAVELGIAWEELAANSEGPIILSDLTKLLENALNVLGKSDADFSLKNYGRVHEDTETIQRYQLAQLLYSVHNDVTKGHNYALNATAVHYEIGGAYKRFEIWDCPDISEIEKMCPDAAGCNYAICAFDRITGDKLMKLYDDWTFRPTELVTVESAVETVLHFSRSFEKEPVYTDVTDEKASVCTIDPALYTGETALPDATNQDLPNWRGCNIGYNSMFAGALGHGPDALFTEGNLDYLKELGVNFVHIYLSWSYFQGPDHTFDSKVNLSRMEELDEIISWCMERDIHIQLVFNDVPNLDWNHQDINEWFNLCNSVFTDEAVKESVTAFWRMLAKRYAEIPNNYLSFNLMNECDPIDDENYAWALGDAVAAIWEESPGRVIVADVHTPNPTVTGESMAALGCALSYHFYNLRDISVVSPEKEAASPGFYESITGTPNLVNAHLYGPGYWNTELPDAARGSLKFYGAVGGATLSVKIGDISWFDTVMEVSAAGQTLYKDMVPHNYIEEQDYFEIPGDGIVTVAIPEHATSFEISCPEGSCFTMSDISLTLKNGTESPLLLVNDSWNGTPLAEITVNEDGSCTSSLGLEYIDQFGTSLLDLLAVGETYGVDVMIGECGFFESGNPMVAGLRQDTVEELFMDQIETFEKYDLAWCFEYGGRYALVTPAPYLEGIEYRDLKNSPYYVNLAMDAFFREVFANSN